VKSFAELDKSFDAVIITTSPRQDSFDAAVELRHDRVLAPPLLAAQSNKAGARHDRGEQRPLVCGADPGQREAKARKTCCGKV